MKRFRSITMFTIVAVAVMVVANIVYLHSLYNSIKEQSVLTATECLRRADILDIISRMQGASFGEDDSFIKLTLVVQGEKSADGNYEYNHLLENLDRTMSEYFHIVAANSRDMKPRDFSDIEQRFRKELSNLGMNPKAVIVTDTVRESRALDKCWEITINNAEGKALVTGYISPLSGYIFNRMSGIIITSAAILVLMSFLIWYLLHWVGKLRSIEQMKDDFTHNMTHELKTPVAVAYSAADSMLRYYDQSDETRNKQFLNIIMQRLSHLSGMIENILSMSMERFKTMKLNIENVEVKTIVEDVVKMMKLKADKKVEIDITIPDKLSIQADSLHLGNILSNLIDNALKYSGDTVNITINADVYSITISDNGIGINKENLPFIFDKFYRVTSGDRYEVGGYGLGLFYVKQIVGLMGWSIDAASKPNHGTRFTIRFDSNEKRKDIIG